MHLTKEEQIIYNHFNDLSRLANKRGRPVFSGFVGLNEMGLMYKLFEEKNILENYVIVFGGYKDAERKMVCFLPEEGYREVEENDFPIECIKISPVNKKFCDALTHRDFLGTIMGVGIERDQVGDIVVKKADTGNACIGYVFCCQDKASLLLNIKRVRHTSVQAKTVDGAYLSLIQEYKDIHGSVSSMRLDAVTAVAIKMSRSKCLLLIKDGNVHINGRLCTENSKILYDGDIISISGYGKYRIEASQFTTKKGRYHITVKQYI